LHRFSASTFQRFNASTLESAFTVLELVVILGIILVLAGLILSTAGYVQKKAGRSRAETEIAAISAACESYRADNGIYPKANSTDQLDPTSTDLTSYFPAGNVLYQQLSGDVDNDPATGSDDQKNYIAPMLKPNSLGIGQSGPYLKDPWGNPYGYSTMKASDPNAAHGYNPTFDLWSTTRSTDSTQWVKNW
jgi:type II secretory pathway pseudopilin PulG